MTSVKELFDEKVRLPSPPAIALKILEAVRQEESSFEDLAQIITSDPSLAVRVLTLANSSLYGLSQPVTSLSQATSLIGTDALTNIALSFVIVQKFQNPPQGSFDLEYFWRRSITTAVAADLLGNAVEHRDKDLFVSGLLQDIGILILFLSLPEDYTTVLDKKRVSDQTLCDAEKEQFSCDHTEIASYLLTAWNLPESIREPIRHSHSPDYAGNLYKSSAMILKCADKIAAIYNGLHSASKAKDVHSVLTEKWGLSSEAVDKIIDVVGDRSREILELFSIDPGKTKPFSMIIQEANEELGALNISYEHVVLELKQAKQNSEQLAKELQRANLNLKKLAYRDGLTGLYNKRYFLDVFSTELKRSLRYKLPLTLLLLDIDFFKDVNDSYGHPVGDKVLIKVSNILLRLVRDSDVVARYGGEEFAVILPETGAKGAKVLAQRLRRGIAQEQLTNGEHTFSITVSIGLAGTNLVQKGLLTETLIESSDQALYKAKQNGRNRVEQFIL